MDTRVRYLLILAAYIAVVIVAGTAVTVRFTDLDPVDSFYYVVQTLWTVGYGDVVPAGDVGKSITLALNFFGTVGVLSAIGIVSGIVLDRFIVRQRRVEEEASRRLAQMREAVFRWADENGVDREAVEEVLGHERHRCRTHQMERAGGGVPCGFDGGLLPSRGMERLRLVLLRVLHVDHGGIRRPGRVPRQQAGGLGLHDDRGDARPVPGGERRPVDTRHSPADAQ